MKYIIKQFLLFCLVLSCFHVDAQDKVYYKKKKTDNWKVTEISSASIKGTDILNQQVISSTSPEDVLFVFNSNGNFLVIPGLFDDAIKSEVYVRQFFEQSDPGFNKVDKIITLKNDIITGTFQLEKENSIDYTIGNKILSISKKELAVIVYRDGKHKVFANADKSFKSLKAVQDNYYRLAFSAKNKKL